MMPGRHGPTHSDQLEAFGLATIHLHYRDQIVETATTPKSPNRLTVPNNIEGLDTLCLLGYVLNPQFVTDAIIPQVSGDFCIV